MGADMGKALNVGSHDIGVQVGAYYLVKLSDGAPQWIIRVQLTPCFRRDDRQLHLALEILCQLREIGFQRKGP